MKSKFLAAGAVLALAAAVPVLAHHSFAAEFDASKAIRLTGTLTKIEWTNPHSYFYVDVKDEKGQIANWGCEGAGPGALSRRGFKRGDIKIGDTLIVDGYRAKDGSRLIDARRVTLPDGRNIYGGTPGDGGPGDTGPGGATASKP
ncbi:MAG: DUF6152 family protein [Bryobacteraceae bacterium]|jgi:hypothetical protein